MNSNNDLMGLLKFISTSQNPQDFVYNMVLERCGNNPMFQNLLSLAKSNNTNGIQTVARNLCKQRGLDFDKEFSNFKHLIGGK